MQETRAVADDMSAPPNGIETGQRHPGTHERQPETPIAVSLEFDVQGHRSASARQRRITTAIIVAFWAVQYVYLSISFALMNPGEHCNVYLPRVFVTLAGLLISFGMIAVQKRLRESQPGVPRSSGGADGADRSFDPFSDERGRICDHVAEYERQADRAKIIA